MFSRIGRSGLRLARGARLVSAFPKVSFSEKTDLEATKEKTDAAQTQETQRKEAKPWDEYDDSDLPLHEREFNELKYKQRPKNMKISTGLVYMDVEPFPRMKLMKIYYIILDKLKELPKNAGYRVFVEELTKYRMRIVEDNEDVDEIERLIGFGCIEELIDAANHEISCIRAMKIHKPWEAKPLLAGEEGMFELDNDFISADFDKDTRQWQKPSRPKTAGFHPDN